MPGRQVCAKQGALAAGIFALSLLVLSCGTSTRQGGLPPSASDLPVLRAVELCDSNATFQRSEASLGASAVPWGTGEELKVASRRDVVRAKEFYFFDQDGMLVGFFIAFPEGLPLKPYPVLRETLSQLRPTLEFYQDLGGHPAERQVETTVLYLTGEKKTTHQYLVLGKGKSAQLVSVTMSIDPYFQLLSPYRQEFLNRLGTLDTTAADGDTPKSHPEDEESFVALQQFARGETALLSYCGERNESIAADAYERALKAGFSNPELAAEAHHKLGLALKASGDLDRARIEMEQSLEMRPNRPDVLNNLGEVYEEMGQHQKAVAYFEHAVALKPNYAIARFNLAEAYEQFDKRRAVEEYETYLAIAEDVPEEAGRTRLAKERVKQLTR